MIGCSPPGLVRHSRMLLLVAMLLAALFAVVEVPRWAAAVPIAPILGA
jgi:hypothetical protein